MFSLLTWIILGIGLIIIKYGFIQPLEDNKLYKLYEARDNVALAAIEGKISQEKEEYEFVIKNINFAIYYIKNNYDFSILIHNLLFSPEELKVYFDNMFSLVEKYDFLQKNYQLTSNCFKRSLNIRFFFFINFLVKPFCIAMLILMITLKGIRKVTTHSFAAIGEIERRIYIISEINSDYNQYRKVFAK